jgi:hypothetical protein
MTAIRYSLKLRQTGSIGGRLVLLGNDKGNAEFEHFNRLVVFAVGDPWLYNEYIDRNDNRKRELGG